MPVYRTSSTFRSKVFEIVKKIPRGKTLTYKQVAQMAGSPRACRAVGNILGKNYDSKIPCHRVIRSDGKTGGYNRGAGKKMDILEEEASYLHKRK
ncbi:MAG TPA: 6-O-methylguanine DNA methyltransferase [Candidatus Moranbacteria bacterium]|nr:6-O-methylguanine DNA methyltransferase [Candidatus Moranbacteria bacterium]